MTNNEKRAESINLGAGQIVEPIDRATLSPCPFCGGEWQDAIKALRDGYADFQDDQDAYAYWIACNSCAATGGWAKSLSGAVRWWNMRNKKEATNE